MLEPVASAERALLPAGAEPPRLIVCERTGRWAMALRRELAGTDIRPRETRSLADAWDALTRSPSSFIVVELSAGNAPELLRRLERLGHDYPLARAAVVSHRRLAPFETLLREAGAVHYVCSPRRLPALADVLARHLAQAPAPPRGWAERVWAGLPWPRAARQ